MEEFWRSLFQDVSPVAAGMPPQEGQTPIVGQPPLPQAGQAPVGQPGAAPPTPAPAPENPSQPLPGQPAGGPDTVGQKGQPEGLRSKATLSREMQQALAMMMSPGAEPRMPSAPGAARPQVQPFLPGGQLMQPGPRFAARRGL